jgi:ribosomal protein S12 methylthiotransferase
MVGEGVREFNLISQDTTYFGMDLWQEKAGPRALVDSSRGPTLTRLLESLETIDGDFWIRLLYTHPAHWSSELMQCIANTRKVARYVDMPLQHIHPQMLDRMQRETSAERIRNIISEMRATIPGLAIRTTFIVGFPGETDEHFDCLAEFVSDTRFERLGVFTYSQEDGSRAAKFDEQVPVKIRRARQRSLMLLQQSVAKANASAQIGSVRRVLMDTPAVGRTEADAPDVDCRVYLETPTIAGEFADVLITGTRDYDLEGQINR